MKNFKILGAIALMSSLVGCGGGAAESSKNKPDSLLPDGFVRASSSSVASSSSSSAASAGAGSSSSAGVQTDVLLNTSLPLREKFDALNNTTFFNKSYKPLASNFLADPDGGFYFPIAGLLENRILVGEGKLTIGNARFSIGQAYSASALGNSTASPQNSKINSTQGTDTQTWGELDLSKNYKISFCVVAATTAGSMQVYVNNNTTAEASSIHLGGSTGSRIFNTVTSGLVAGKRVEINIPGNTTAETGGTALAVKSTLVGTAKSFLQIRADSSAKVTIDDLWIGYQDDLSTEPAASTCAAGSHLVAPVTSSSSSAASSSVSSVATSSSSSTVSSAASSTVVVVSSSSSVASSTSSSSSSLVASSSSSSSSSVVSTPAWACPSSGLYFCDDFAGNNTNKWDLLPAGTGNSLVPNGAFDIAADGGNNILRYTAAGTGGVIALVKPSAFTGVTSADYYVEAKIRPRANSTTSNKQIYIIARYQDGNNWYAGALNVQNANTSTQVEIAKMKAGSISRPKQVKKPLEQGTAGMLDGQWYTLRLELIGTSLTVYLDGENLGSVTDADFTTQGLIGFWTANKSFEVDDIKVGDANQKPASLLLSPTASSYAAEVGDAARVIAVTAKTDAGVADTFTVVSSNPSVVSVSTAGTNVSLTPVSEGSATITFTSGSKPDLKRTITATIAQGFVMPTATYSLTGLVMPAAGETNSYEDQILNLTFDAPPTLGTAGSVRIFKVSDDSLVDTIKLTAESDSIGYGTLRVLNTKPIRISGNTASISLHSNKLALGTAYYVAISDTVFTGATLNGKAFAGIGKNAGWTFTTRAAAPAAGLTSLTVDDTGTTADYRTLQGALNYVMQHVAADTAATITVKNGTYEEPLYLRNKNNLTIVGESRSGTVIQYSNNELLNSGSNGRALFLVDTSDLLTLDTLTLKNTTLIGAGGQAETIYFNSPSGRLVAKNANFISEQDTLLLKGWTWFYKSLVAGNVDFIWGYSKASLFEQSEIRSLGRSSSNANGGYVLQARVESATDKGFVFLNSSLTSGAGPTNEAPIDGTHYLARSPGGTTTFDNIVFINTKMGKHINGIGWAGSGINAQPASNPGTGTATTGWREYGSMDSNGTTLDVSKRQFGYQLSLGDIATSFCSRAHIFAAFNSNAGWNPMPSDTSDCVTPPATTKDWGFDSAAYAAAGTTLFAAAYDATLDNGIKVTGGDVSVDGLVFNSTAANVIRYRPAGSVSNATATAVWNTNGAFFTNNTTLIPAVGADLPTNVRTFIAIPVTSGAAFTITLNYKQTSTSATAGKIALVGSDGKVLAVKDAHKDTAAATGDTLTLSVPAGHTQTFVKVIYGREGVTSGGVNITSMQRVQ